MATPNSTTTTTKKAKIDSIHLYIYIYTIHTISSSPAQSYRIGRLQSFQFTASSFHLFPSNIVHPHPFATSIFIHLCNQIIYTYIIHTAEKLHIHPRKYYTATLLFSTEIRKKKTYFKMKQTRENIHTKK